MNFLLECNHDFNLGILQELLLDFLLNCLKFPYCVTFEGYFKKTSMSSLKESLGILSGNRQELFLKFLQELLLGYQQKFFLGFLKNFLLEFNHDFILGMLQELLLDSLLNCLMYLLVFLLRFLQRFSRGL